MWTWIQEFSLCGVSLGVKLQAWPVSNTSPELILQIGPQGFFKVQRYASIVPLADPWSM